MRYPRQISSRMSGLPISGTVLPLLGLSAKISSAWSITASTNRAARFRLSRAMNSSKSTRFSPACCDHVTIMDYPHFFGHEELFVVRQSFGYAHFQRPQSPSQQNQEKISGTPIRRNQKLIAVHQPVCCFG